MKQNCVLRALSARGPYVCAILMMLHQIEDQISEISKIQIPFQ